MLIYYLQVLRIMFFGVTVEKQTQQTVINHVLGIVNKISICTDEIQNSLKVAARQNGSEHYIDDVEYIVYSNDDADIIIRWAVITPKNKLVLTGTPRINKLSLTIPLKTDARVAYLNGVLSVNEYFRCFGNNTEKQRNYCRMTTYNNEQMQIYINGFVLALYYNGRGC